MSVDSLDSQRRFLESIPTGLSESSSGISPVRRLFCLIVFFDFLLSGILWITGVVIRGTSIETELWKDIFKYNISTSLFDLVIGGGLRFIFLIIAYGCFKWKHWFVVACTTLTSVVFIITKLFYYQWVQHTTYMFEIIFLLSSLFISFVEAWFLDYKVVSEEQRSAVFLRNLYTDVGRASVLSSVHLRKYLEECNGEGSLYFSPTHSQVSDGDDDDDNTTILTPDQVNLKMKGEKTCLSGLELLGSPNWSLEKDQDSISIYSMRTSNWGKIFKLVTSLDLDHEVIYHEVFHNFPSSIHWNTSVVDCRIVEVIDHKTDVVYYVSKPPPVGLVNSRDFVVLRHCKQTHQGHLISMVSIDHPRQPVHKNYTRGENGPCAIYLKRSSEDPARTCFEWLLSVDLKLRFLTNVSEQMIPKAMVEYIQNLTSFLKECKV